MDIKEYEDLIKNKFSSIVKKIIEDIPTLPIDVNKGERVGDAISKFLEKKFVEYTENNEHINQSKASPVGKTKNPWDAKTYFKLNGHNELFWIDFKAINLANEDSNPDSGTPNKVFELIEKENSFYLIFILVYYEGLGEGNGLKFNGDVKCVFLKDVEKNMHITPSNQIQFNVFAPEVYRTRSEFIDFLNDKLVESNQRKLDDATEKLKLIKEGKYKVPKTINKNKFVVFENLKTLNDIQENKIKNI
jgi:hypothetical protein